MGGKHSHEVRFILSKVRIAKKGEKGGQRREAGKGEQRTEGRQTKRMRMSY